MIRVEGLRKGFGGEDVLRGVDLTVRDGEILVLVGGSGEGKSVLLKHIIGLLTPDSGRVLVDDDVSVGDLDYEGLQSLRERMGYVFQDAALLEGLTVRENLRLALDDETCECDSTYCDRRIEKTFRTVNLDHDVLDRHPSELSGGMRKRVGVARGIIHAPDIVLYDEPTTGLDPQNVVAISRVIRNARDDLGATSLVTTHDLEVLRRVADRVALLYEGCIRFVGPVDAFLKADDPVIRDYLGREEIPTMETT